MKEETPALTQAPSSASVPPPEPPPAARSDAPPSRRGVGWAGPVALLALIGAGLAGWQVYELRAGAGELRQAFAQRLAAADATATEVRTLSRQQQESVAALQSKLGAVESQLAASEGQAAALETLYQEFSRTRDDRLVAEAEQAISMAAQQLQLAGNVEAALIALEGAEARLAAQERGQLQSLRRALNRDIEQLKLMPHVDVPGIARRLEETLARVDKLPLAFAGELPSQEGADQPPAAGESAADQPAALAFLTDLARDLWYELRSLVRVERLDQREPVLLAPAQSTYLRENLKIRLLTARLALLARDGRTFSSDIGQARNWIERFFDSRDQGVQDVLAELKTLEATPIRVEAPELTESLAALRQLQARARDQRPAVPESGRESAPAEPAPAQPSGQR